MSAAQLGLYNGLAYAGMSDINLGNASLIGLKPESGSYGVGFDLTSQLTQGDAMVYVVGADYFDLSSFYFGCVALATTTLASVPLGCSIDVAGFRNGAQVATQSFTFTGGSGGLQPDMTLATLTSAFTKLDYISLTNTGTLAVAEFAVFDNLKYKICSYKP